MDHEELLQQLTSVLQAQTESIHKKIELETGKIWLHIENKIEPTMNLILENQSDIINHRQKVDQLEQKIEDLQLQVLALQNVVQTNAK